MPPEQAGDLAAVASSSRFNNAAMGGAAEASSSERDTMKGRTKKLLVDKMVSASGEWRLWLASVT
uniref:Uncharacterized protein n=1 Tax=Oryza nivara TaxID=4536 RepID=A0A0E0I5I4_ORYNI